MQVRDAKPVLKPVIDLATASGTPDVARVVSVGVSEDAVSAKACNGKMAIEVSQGDPGRAENFGAESLKFALRGVKADDQIVLDNAFLRVGTTSLGITPTQVEMPAEEVTRVAEVSAPELSQALSEACNYAGRQKDACSEVFSKIGILIAGKTLLVCASDTYILYMCRMSCEAQDRVTMAIEPAGRVFPVLPTGKISIGLSGKFCVLSYEQEQTRIRLYTTKVHDFPHVWSAVAREHEFSGIWVQAKELANLVKAFKNHVTLSSEDSKLTLSDGSQSMSIDVEGELGGSISLYPADLTRLVTGIKERVGLEISEFEDMRYSTVRIEGNPRVRMYIREMGGA